MTYEKARYLNYRAFSVSGFGTVPLLSRRYLALLVLFFLVALICPLGVPMYEDVLIANLPDHQLTVDDLKTWHRRWLGTRSHWWRPLR